MKAVAIFVLGVLIGGAAAGGYAFTLLRDAQQQIRSAETSRDALDKTAKEQVSQLKQTDDKLKDASNLLNDAKAQAADAKGKLKSAEDQLNQLQASKQAVEATLKETKDELARAQAALAEAKKSPTQ